MAGARVDDSGKKKYIANKLHNDRTAAIIEGILVLLYFDNTIAPVAGPKINARPNAAPKTPNPFDLSFSSVMSVMYACARDMFPPSNPSSTLLNKIISIEVE